MFKKVLAIGIIVAIATLGFIKIYASNDIFLERLTIVADPYNNSLKIN